MIDVKALAQQAGIDYVFIAGYSRELVNTATDDELETFAALVLKAAAKTKVSKARRLPRRGTGALWDEQQFCYEKGWKAGVAAMRSAIRAMKPKGDV